MQIDFAFFDTLGVEQVDAVFDAGNAVRDKGEIGTCAAWGEIGVEGFVRLRMAHVLLGFEVKRRVIGADGVDGAIGQSRPEYGLIFHVADGRTHDVFGPFKVRLLSGGFIEHEVGDDGLDPNVHAT